jgi:hypothetical protein
LAIVRENERKKEYLKGYIYSVRKAQRLKEQIEELRSQQMFPSANHDGMPQGNAHSDLSGYVARLDALVSQLEYEQAMAVRQYKEIHDRIHQMQDGAEKEVLIRRYLMGRKWEQIAVDMDYNYRSVLKIHGRALRSFEISERGH